MLCFTAYIHHTKSLNTTTTKSSYNYTVASMERREDVTKNWIKCCEVNYNNIESKGRMMSSAESYIISYDIISHHIISFSYWLKWIK